MYPVAAALYSIVRGIETAHLTAAAAYGLSRNVYDVGVYRYFSAVAEPLQSTLLTVYGKSRFLGQHGKSCNMVGVLMGYEYSLYRFKRYVIHFEGIAEPSEADSAVSKYSAFFSSDK